MHKTKPVWALLLVRDRARVRGFFRRFVQVATALMDTEANVRRTLRAVVTFRNFRTPGFGRLFMKAFLERECPHFLLSALTRFKLSWRTSGHCKAGLPLHHCRDRPHRAGCYSERQAAPNATW